MCLRTIRHISKGEQLLAWYETALAMELNIPFISFQNIRGKLMKLNAIFRIKNYALIFEHGRGSRVVR